MEMSGRKSQLQSVQVKTTIQGGPAPQAGASLNRALRPIHLVSGLVAGVWLLLMAVTGVVINHQETLGLHHVEVSNRLLPRRYADEFHPESTSAAVVISDLHSGRFFGPRGRLLDDAVALMLILSVLSGGLYYLRRPSQSNPFARPAPVSRNTRAWLTKSRARGGRGRLPGDSLALLLILSVLSGGLYYLRRHSR